MQADPGNTRVENGIRRIAVSDRIRGTVEYELEAELGRGAMGLVYRGWHSMLHRPTAIKMLHPDREGSEAVARFEREVRLTSQLNHPNTISIYDYGRTTEGRFYYAMEYLDGIDLQTLVNNYGPQPASRVVEILVQICGSLSEAHANGLVHRDIKPANIMLNRRGGRSDVVKVLDFGLVKSVGEIVHQPQQSGGITGTPLYMAPEAFSRPNLVDARSDLYGLGAVAYFLLTGRPVFQTASMLDLMREHGYRKPSPLSGNEAVSPTLEKTIQTCLAKKPSHRPQTAHELTCLLNSCSIAQPWESVTADAWWSRHEALSDHVLDPERTASRK